MTAPHKKDIENNNNGSSCPDRDKKSRYSNEWGKIAEKIAADFLVAKGMPVRERNWSPSGGHKEIDIISQKGNRIVFVEVKARSGRDSMPIDAMTKNKINNIYRCAESYLKTLPEDYWEYQFDIIAVTGDPSSYTVEHIEDAFLGPLRTYH